MPAVKNNYSNVISWCAEEVDRQTAGPRYVAYMFDAWERASNESPNDVLSPNRLEVFIRMLNAKVLGGSGLANYRTTEVYFADLSLALPPRQVPMVMNNLCSIGVQNLEPGDFVFEFLKIHPFPDGNGRTAALLLNWLSGSLDNPIVLHDFFHTELTEEPRKKDND